VKDLIPEKRDGLGAVNKKKKKELLTKEPKKKGNPLSTLKDAAGSTRQAHKLNRVGGAPRRKVKRDLHLALPVKKKTSLARLWQGAGKKKSGENYKPHE